VDEVRASVALARGDLAEALRAGERSYRRGIAADSTAPLTAGRAAAWLGDGGALREARTIFDPLRGRANDAARRELGAAQAILEDRRMDGITGFLDAIRRWREVGLEFEAAICALGLITMVGPRESDAVAAGLFAGSVFERVGAIPFQALLQAAMRAVPSATPARTTTPVVDDAIASVTPAD
jgi:hypothetical protein